MKADFENEEELFPRRITDISQAVTKLTLEYFQAKYKVDMSGSFHNYKLIRLLIMLNPNKSSILGESLVDAIEFIINTHNSKLELMDDIVTDSFKKRDEALHFFWEYICTTQLLKDKKLSFRKKTAYRFSMIHQIIEHMLKRESYLLYVSFNVENETSIVKDVKLNEIIEILLKLPFEYFKSIDQNKLKNISLNQWRNIAAHSSYECINETIECTYSNNKNKVITLSELDEVISEIYGLRLFVKLVTNLTLEILQIRLPKYQKVMMFVPESVVTDLNTYYEQFKTRIKAIELKDSIMIEDKLYSQENESYFEIDIESEYNERLTVVQLAILSIIQLSNIINGNNCSVKLEDLVWIFNIIFSEDGTRLKLAISFDEVSLLLDNPVAYIEVFKRKLLQSSQEEMKRMLKIE
ncbi:hypothetical protein ACWGPW_27200 [Paenibacillus chitinolyticus]